MSRVVVLFLAGVCSCTPFSSTSDSVAEGGASVDASALPAGGSEGCREAVVDGFETGPLPGPWDGITQSGATLTFDTVDKANGSRSLLFKLTAPSGTAYLTKRIPSAKHVCCELNVRTNGADSTGFLEFTGKAMTNHVAFSWLPGRADIDEGAPKINRIVAFISTISDAGAWTHVRVEADYGPGATRGTLKVYANGALSVQDTLGDTTDDLSFDTILLGSYYSTAQGTDRSAWFDDVSCGAR